MGIPITGDPKTSKNRKHVSRLVEHVLNNKLAALFVSLEPLKQLGASPDWLLNDLENATNDSLDFIEAFNPKSDVTFFRTKSAPGVSKLDIIATESTPGIYSDEFRDPFLRRKNTIDKSLLMRQMNFSYIYTVLSKAFGDVKTEVDSIKSKGAVLDKRSLVTLEEKIRTAANTVGEILKKLRN